MKIKDLKVGDMVFIREDLEVCKGYGSAYFAKDMKQGVQRIMSIDSAEEDFNIASEADSFRYHYTPEMIDWEKTKKLQKNNYCDFEEITQSRESGNEVTKAVTHDGKEIIVKNNNEENDVEKAVMLLMLKSLGVTYSEIKKEVENVKVKWRPAEGDRYYYIREIGDISSWFWSELSWDYYRFDFNNCFKTIEEAERKAEEIKELLKGE